MRYAAPPPTSSAGTISVAQPAAASPAATPTSAAFPAAKAPTTGHPANADHTDVCAATTPVVTAVVPTMPPAMTPPVAVAFANSEKSPARVA